MKILVPEFILIFECRQEKEEKEAKEANSEANPERKPQLADLQRLDFR